MACALAFRIRAYVDWNLEFGLKLNIIPCYCLGCFLVLHRLASVSTNLIESQSFDGLLSHCLPQLINMSWAWDALRCLIQRDLGIRSRQKSRRQNLSFASHVCFYLFIFLWGKKSKMWTGCEFQIWYCNKKLCLRGRCIPVSVWCHYCDSSIMYFFGLGI